MPVHRFVYDPWELPPEQRQTTFVGRGQILERLLAAVREQEDRATIQHYILTGPRGIGKTTLLLTLRDRIRQDPATSAKWFCIQLREEEYYVHKQRDLWELVLRALAAEEKLLEAQKVVEQAQAARDDEKSSALLVDGLREICNRYGKRLLLLIDNFDQIFPNTAAGRGKHRKADSEYRAFRKRLSTEHFLMLISTSVKVFQDIYAYDKGFFNFFSSVELPELGQEEVAEMLRRLGQADENDEFLSRLKRSAVNFQTLSFLTGGNPRLVTMLYHVLAQREIAEPVQALWESVAGLTPMLRQELAEMPRQQSKTLDALLRLNSAASPAEISKNSRLPLNVVTTQLGRLKEARYVALEGGGKGKTAIYRVADQMFRTWYLMRYVPVARRRVELFVDFLRAWFSEEERRRLFLERWDRYHKYRSCGSVGMAAQALRDAEYYAASLGDLAEQRRGMERIADAYVSTEDWSSAACLLGELAGGTQLKSRAKFESVGYELLGARFVVKGDVEHALKSYSEALGKRPENTEARVLYGLCLALSQRYAEAVEQFDQVLEVPRQTVARRALVLRMRGLAKAQLGDPLGEVADYTAVIGLKDAPVEEIADALVSRGVTKGELGDLQGEIVDCTAVVQLKGAPAEHVSDALAHRAEAKIHLGDYQGAITDCTAAAQVEGALPVVVARALVNRGRAKGQMGDAQSEIADCTAGVELKGAEVEEVSAGLVNRAAAKGRLGDHRGAIADCSAAVELKGTPTEEMADALYNRGVSKGALENLPGAIADYTAVVDLKGAPVEITARALVNRALIKADRDDREGAITDFMAVINLKGARAEEVGTALVLRGWLYVDQGKAKHALRDFNRSLKIPALPKNLEVGSVFGRSKAHLLVGNLEEGLADCDLCARSGMLPFVHDGLRVAVTVLLSLGRTDEALAWVRQFHELEPVDVALQTRLEARLEMIRMASGVASLEDVGRLVDALLESDPEELRSRLQFVKPGLELARTNDESVLAKLPEDERRIARQIAEVLKKAAHQRTAQSTP